jgi:D-alanyl-D-alanine carboxypeptidase
MKGCQMQALVGHRRRVVRGRVVRGVAAAALIGLALSGCTGAPAPSESPSTASAAPPTKADSAALTAQFKELAKHFMVPGAAMLIRTPDGDITSTYGTTTLGGSTPVSLDDHLRVGSNTKTWTATVILQLVRRAR